MATGRDNHCSRSLKIVLFSAVVASSLRGARGAESSLQLAEPFRSEYSGERATGKQIMGLWQFDAPDPGADASGGESMASFEQREERLEPGGESGHGSS